MVPPLLLTGLRIGIYGVDNFLSYFYIEPEKHGSL